MSANMANKRYSKNGGNRTDATCANDVRNNVKSKGNNSSIERRRSYVSLFSGAMGLDIGLERAGFNCVVCNEIDPLAVETIKLNKPTLPVISGSIEKVTLDTLNEAAGFSVAGIDLLAGGPPCQAFSVF